jgi:hypothetical protein
LLRALITSMTSQMLKIAPAIASPKPNGRRRHPGLPLGQGPQGYLCHHPIPVVRPWGLHCGDPITSNAPPL